MKSLLSRRHTHPTRLASSHRDSELGLSGGSSLSPVLLPTHDDPAERLDGTPRRFVLFSF